MGPILELYECNCWLLLFNESCRLVGTVEPLVHPGELARQLKVFELTG